MNAFSIRFHSIDYSEASGLKIDNIKIVLTSESTNKSIVDEEGIDLLSSIINAMEKDRRSRYDIKKANDLCQNEIELMLEPILASQIFNGNCHNPAPFWIINNF